MIPQKHLSKSVDHTVLPASPNVCMKEFMVLCCLWMFRGCSQDMKQSLTIRLWWNWKLPLQNLRSVWVLIMFQRALVHVVVEVRYASGHSRSVGTITEPQSVGRQHANDASHASCLHTWRQLPVLSLRGPRLSFHPWRITVVWSVPDLLYCLVMEAWVTCP